MVHPRFRSVIAPGLLAAALALPATAAEGDAGASEAPSFDSYPKPEGLAHGQAADIATTFAAVRDLPLGKAAYGIIESQVPVGFDETVAMIEGMHGLAFEVELPAEGADEPTLAAELGLEPEALATLWTALIGAPAEAESFENDDLTYAKQGAGLQIAGGEGAQPRAVAGVGLDSGLLVSWNADAARVVADQQGLAGEERAIVDLLPSGHYHLDVDGPQVAEHLLLDRSLRDLGLQAVDPALLDDIPDQAVLVLAVGGDPGTLVEALGPQGEQLIQAATGMMAMYGIEGEGGALLDELTGNWLIWIAQGAPFPTIGIQIPDGEGPLVAAAIEALGAQQGMLLPEVGATTNVPLPPEAAASMPMQLILARRADAWLLTTDMLLAGRWAEGTAVGTESGTIRPELQAGLDQGGLVVGASHTAGVAQMMAGYVPMLGMLSPQLPQQIQPVIQAMLTAPNGSLVVAEAGAGSRASTRSQLPMLPVLGMMGLGAFLQQQRPVMHGIPEEDLIEDEGGEAAEEEAGQTP